VLGDLADGRTPRLCGDVVPAQAPAGGMGADIEVVAGEVRHVDAADEREHRYTSRGAPRVNAGDRLWG
jgi:hypothetical protein